MMDHIENNVDETTQTIYVCKICGKKATKMWHMKLHFEHKVRYQYQYQWRYLKPGEKVKKPNSMTEKEWLNALAHLGIDPEKRKGADD